MADRTEPRRKPRRKGGTLKDGERRQLALASRHAAVAAAPEPTDGALVLCDGGSRGNPGPAAVAAILLAADGAVLAQEAHLIGHASAAEAEYRALALGLALALAAGLDAIELRSDSQLAIAALDGSGPDASEHAALADAVRQAAAGFTAVRWRWHPRDANEAADTLVRDLLWP